MDADFIGQLTPSKTAEILQKIGHVPNKNLGQNFLVDANIVRKSVNLAKVEEGDLVVEVGPGLGTLTGALLERGAKVFAVELDRGLYAHLLEVFKDRQNLNLINANALRFPLAGLPPDTERYKIVANLPYAISTAWLDNVLSEKFLPERMSLMLQKEAADRFCAAAKTGEYSPISIFLSCAYAVESRHKVSGQCFYPKPAIDSALVSLARLKDPYIFCAAAKNLIRKIFIKRRKQIGSIVKSSGADAEILGAWLARCDSLDPKSRPETIEMRYWKLLDEIAKQ